jgi:hypothetical protein
LTCPYVFAVSISKKLTSIPVSCFMALPSIGQVQHRATL